MLFDSVPRAFGLDIGDFSLKLTVLERRRDFRGRHNFFLKNYGAIGLPPGLIIDGEIKDALKLKIFIKSLLKQAVLGPVKFRGVIASLPENRTFLKEISIPKLINGNSFPLIREELEKQIPTPLDELYLDWQEMEPVKSKGEVKIVVAAAPKTLVDSYTALLESAGLQPLVFEIESLALSRTIIGDQEFSPEDTKIIIDIGAERTSIIFWRNGAPRLSVSSESSGHAITSAIAEKQKITLTEAEKIKLQCGLDPENCPGEIKEIISKNLEELVKDTKSAIRYYLERVSPETRIEKIILSGGGANLDKLESILSQELKIKVRQAVPITNFKKPKYLAWTPKHHLSFATALGLARRAAENRIFE